MIDPEPRTEPAFSVVDGWVTCGSCREQVDVRQWRAEGDSGFLGVEFDEGHCPECYAELDTDNWHEIEGSEI